MDKSLNKIIPLVIYPFDVMVSFGESDEQLAKVLNKHGFDLTDVDIAHKEGREGRCTMLHSGQTVLRLYKYPKTPVQYGYLQHEIFHAVEFVMERIGMKLCRKSDEAYAYLIQYLTTEIHKCLKSQ